MRKPQVYQGKVRFKFISHRETYDFFGADISAHAGQTGELYWIERCVQDAKTSVGMADYQARGWIAWHHHMALVMLAMLFVLRERKLHEREVDLLSYQDIIELLNVHLPRADRTKEAVLENMRQRHAKRRAAIDSARRKSHA